MDLGIGTNPTAAQLDRDAGDRRIWFRLITPEPDRDGTITLPAGVRLEKYLKRPVFCWNHPISSKDGSEPPPAPPEAVIGRVVDHRQSELALDILVEFAPEEANPQAETCYQLVRGGYLGAVSYCGPILRQEDRDVGGRTVPVNVETELWEASLVIVGSIPGAQVLQRALTALHAQRAAPPSSSAPAPAARTSPSEPQPAPTKRGPMEREELNTKLGLPSEGVDTKVASKALDRYMDTTSDGPEQRAQMRTAFESHYAEGKGEQHKEPDGDEAPPAEKAAEDEGEKKPEELAEKAADDLDKEEDPEVLRAAVRMAQRAAAFGPARAASGPDAGKIAAEVDKMIEDGLVERDAKRREEAIGLHARNKLVPALRTAGIKPGTFTTSQRLHSGKLGTTTEFATRRAGGGPERKPAPEAQAQAEAAADGKRTIADMDAALAGRAAKH